MTAATRIAIVLGHDSCAAYPDGGAIGLIARELLDSAGEALIFGPPDATAPLAGPGFLAVRPGWREAFRRPKSAYRAGLIRALRRFAPAIIEVHNQRVLPERLRRALPAARIVSVLHSEVVSDLADRTAWLAAVDAAVCVSGFIRAGLVQDVPAALARRARVIHNPAPPAPAGPDAAREPVILFAGRLVPEKGPESFVAAAAMLRGSLPGWRFLLIGSEGVDPSPEARAFADSVRAQATAAGVEVLGQLPNAATRASMAKARIVVMPSRVAEALGRVAQEALAAGAALVATRRGGIPEAAGEAAIYVDPDRPAEIADAIRRLATDDSHWSALTGLGRAQVQRFAPREILGQWAALRAELLAAPGPALRSARP